MTRPPASSTRGEARVRLDPGGPFHAHSLPQTRIGHPRVGAGQGRLTAQRSRNYWSPHGDLTKNKRLDLGTHLA